jgi:hypothetical protein
MVEQWTENPCVPGSIPGGTTYNPKQLFRVFVFKKLTVFYALFLCHFTFEKVSLQNITKATTQ